MNARWHALVALSSSLAACSAPASTPDPKPTTSKPEPVEASIPVTHTIWDTSCSACHGDRGAFSSQSKRDADATLSAITAGTDTAPWHAFWFLGDANRRALTHDITGSKASATPSMTHRWATSRLEQSRESLLALDPDTRARSVEKLSIENCSACHGDEGRGDGPAAAGLRPRPRDWSTMSTGEWQHSPSPSGVFATLTQGIDGTAMASYTNLSIKARWMLAEHVVSKVPESVRAADPYDELEQVAAGMAALDTPPTRTQLSTPRTWAKGALAELDGDNIDGQAIYRQFCASCHGESGKGVPEVYPPLVGVPWTNDPKRHAAHIEVILNGLAGKIQVGEAEYDGVMQPFHMELDDLQVAALATWVNTSWGNQGGEVSVVEVERVRSSLGYPPFNAAASPPDRSDSAQILAAATCAGCHGESGARAPGLGTYQGMTVERFAAALVSPESTHPRLGAAMHPSAWSALVEQVTDATCGDGCVRAQLDALSER